LQGQGVLGLVMPQEAPGIAMQQANAAFSVVV
jgi:hypothetical protein